MRRVIVYAERTTRYEIEVEPSTEGQEVATARRAIEEAPREGVLSYWEAEEPLDFNVEVLT